MHIFFCYGQTRYSTCRAPHSVHFLCVPWALCVQPNSQNLGNQTIRTLVVWASYWHLHVTCTSRGCSIWLLSVRNQYMYLTYNQSGVLRHHMTASPILKCLQFTSFSQILHNTLTKHITILHSVFIRWLHSCVSFKIWLHLPTTLHVPGQPTRLDSRTSACD